MFGDRVDRSHKPVVNGTVVRGSGARFGETSTARDRIATTLTAEEKMGFRSQDPGPQHDVREMGFGKDFGTAWACPVPVDLPVPKAFAAIHADETS